MERAPYFADIARGPAGGTAWWVRAGDGVRLRVAAWRDGARGSVLLLPGRTEYVEKYGPAAADLAARGYSVITIDWRGQGLSDRDYRETGLGYVEAFGQYQDDLAAMLAAAAALDMPRPFTMLAHSMGGCIGLRALTEGVKVGAVVFTAPMWGLPLSPLLRPAAWALTNLGRPLRLGRRPSPGSAADSYITSVAFEANLLTGDREMFDFMRGQLAAHPELELGGPSLAWAHEALQETQALARLPTPAVPAHAFLGTEEGIVDPAAVEARMADWPDGRLEMVEGARHEVMMDGPQTRRRVFDTAAALFAGRPGGPAPQLP